MTCTLDAIPGSDCTIEYFSGDTVALSFAVYDDDGNPVDLLSDDLKWQAKRKRTDTNAIAELTSSGGGIVVAGTNNNEVTLFLDFQVDQDIYYHNLVNITVDKTILYGKFLVTGDVIR